MYYGVVKLTNKVGGLAGLLERMEPAATGNDLRGTLKGCWYSDIGVLNQVMVLFHYEDAAAIAKDRANLLEGGDPFGAGEFVTDMEFGSYKTFPGVAVAPAGDFGPIYEMRRYTIKLDGLRPTIDAWAKVREARSKLSPLLTVMYSLDGTVPHFLHIWPYRSLEDRGVKRAKAVEQGIWPPPGGPPYLRAMHSDIYFPAPFSPAK